MAHDAWILEGHKLLAVRILWFLVNLVAILIYAVFVPVYYVELLSNAQAVDTIVLFGFSPEVYAGFIVIRDVSVTVIFLLAGFLYVRERRTDGRVIFVSSIFALGGVVIPSTISAEATTELMLLSDIIYLVAACGFIILLYILPDGRFYPDFTKILAVFWLLAVVLDFGLSIFVPALGWPENSLLPFTFIWLAFGISIQVYRYIKIYDPTRKQQTKWMISGFLFLLLGSFCMNLGRFLIQGSLGIEATEVVYNMYLISVFGVIPALSLPITFGVSLLRYRLWDLGYLLRRLLRMVASLSVISAILGFGFFLSTSLGFLSYGLIESVTIVFMVSLLILFLNPLHKRIQNLVISRRPIVSEEVIDDFMNQLKTTVEPDQIAAKVETRIQDLFDPSKQAFFEFSSGTGPVYLSSRGMDKDEALNIVRRNDVGYSLHRKIVMLLEEPRGQAMVIPLTSYSPKGIVITGALYIGPKDTGLGYSTEEIRQLRAIADQAGTSLQVSRLAQELSMSESRYKSLVITSPDAIIESDLNGNITFLNPNATDIIGYESSEVVGKQLFEFVVLEQRELARDEFTLRKISDPEYPAPTFDVVRKDGTVFPARVAASVIDDDEGKPRGYMLVIHDLTSQRQYEASLKEARDRALFYLDLLGHDIRNKLQSLELAGQIAHEIAEKSIHKESLSEVSRVIEKCQSMIQKVEITDDFLTSEIEDIDVVPMLNESLKQIQKVHPDLAIKKRLHVKKAVISGNDFLRHVFNNLLENAIEHNPGPTKTVWVELDKGDNGYMLQIKDNGPGIEDERKKDLFDTKRRFGGVGLHQSREIVSRFNGTIRVQDRIKGEPSKGASFVVWFPELN